MRRAFPISRFRRRLPRRCPVSCPRGQRPPRWSRFPVSCLLPPVSCLLFLSLACWQPPSTSPAPAPPPRRPTPAAAPAPAPTPQPPLPPDPPPLTRLPDHIRPLDYRLELTVDPALEDFSGRVAITVDLAKPTSSIWLHARELTVTKATITPTPTTTTTSASTSTSIALTFLDAPADAGLLGLAADRTLAPGRASITLDFTGKFGSRVGLFRQKEAGRWYAFTDFEPADARRAFPCFDEPRWKTPWTISLIIPSAMRGFANAPEARASPGAGDTRRLDFARTRPLPSYLVAVAVGPFDVVDGAASPVPMRAITLAGRGQQAAQALAMAPPLLRLLEDYVGMPAPFPKLDFVTVPDFYGAMENPGLVTVTADILLVDPARPPPPARRRTQVMVIAHELAHLWFGDLVTPADWNDLWLNEGVATFMTDLIVDRWNPALAWPLDVVAARREAMKADADVDAQPVRRPGARAAELDRGYGQIVYLKGGAVLVAVEGWLGAEVMQRALRAHVRDHVDGNVVAEDFYAALSRAAGVDLSASLRSLVETSGVPLVTADLRCDGPPRVAVTVKRLHPEPFAPTHQLPVCVRWPGGRTCAVITGGAGSIALPAAPDCPAWLHPNAGETGYYRWILPEAQLDALINAPLDPRERLGLIDQLTAAAETGELPPAVVLSRLPVLARGATHHGVAFLVDLVDELRLAASPRAARRLAELTRRAFAGRARALGLLPRAADSEDDARSRAQLVRMAGLLAGDRALRRDARRLVDAWLAGKQTIDGESLDVVLALAAAGGDRRLHARLRADLDHEHSRASVDIDRRWALLGALAGFRSPRLLAASLRLTLAHLRGGEIIRLLGAALDDPQTRGPTIRFVRTHAAELAGRLGPVPTLLARRACSPAEEAAFDPILTAWADGRPERAPVVADVRADAARCATRRHRLRTLLDAPVR